MFLMVTLSVILSVVLIVVNFFFSSKGTSTREAITPFECGYDPKSSARMPFSLHFFLISVIFLIFDVEITLILPMPLIMFKVAMETWVIMSVLFILILIVGTIHEWNEGSLEWSK